MAQRYFVHYKCHMDSPAINEIQHNFFCLSLFLFPFPFHLSLLLHFIRVTFILFDPASFSSFLPSSAFSLIFSCSLQKTQPLVSVHFLELYLKHNVARCHGDTPPPSVVLTIWDWDLGLSHQKSPCSLFTGRVLISRIVKPTSDFTAEELGVKQRSHRPSFTRITGIPLLSFVSTFYLHSLQNILFHPSQVLFILPVISSLFFCSPQHLFFIPSILLSFVPSLSIPSICPSFSPSSHFTFSHYFLLLRSMIAFSYFPLNGHMYIYV